MRKLPAVLAGAAVAAGIVVLPGGSSAMAASSLRLDRFSSCEEVEAWFAEGAERSGAGAVGGDDGERAVEEDASGGGSAPAADTATSSQRDFSGTNLQEDAVDEPDVVKTDGDLLVAAINGTLHVVDARTGDELAAMDLPGQPAGEELLLVGDRVLAIGRAWRSSGDMPSGGFGEDARIGIVAPGEDITTLTAIDVSDPANPTVTSEAELDGSYVSARMTHSSIRVVLQQWPSYGVPEATPAEAWLPSIAVDGGEPEPAADCDDVLPGSVEPTAPGTTTVVTFDADGSLEPEDTDVIAAMASTVYASEDRLYVASQEWTDEGPGTTSIHAFTTGVLDNTMYLGSGQVPGYLLNQWALSEDGGVLRVASTTFEDSRITTFAEGEGRLVPLGELGGLGPSERIYAVRYIGDVGYVVTFRQVDPLYTIDLSDPSDPRVLGELKVTGFSSYLHPVAPGRMLGVGQEATEEGTTTGTSVSLFDTSDLTAPALVDRYEVTGAHSAVEWDHKAFTWWAPSGTAVVPFDRYTETTAESGALVLAVDDSSVGERGRLTHMGRPGVPTEWPPSLLRSMVVGDLLWTLSDAGLLASSLDSLADVAWIDFPNPVFDEGGEPMPIEEGIA